MPAMLPTALVFVRSLPSSVTARLRPLHTPHREQCVCAPGASNALCAPFTIQNYRHRYPETFPELSNSGSLPGKAGGLPDLLK